MRVGQAVDFPEEDSPDKLGCRLGALILRESNGNPEVGNPKKLMGIRGKPTLLYPWQILGVSFLGSPLESLYRLDQDPRLSSDLPILSRRRCF